MNVMVAEPTVSESIELGELTSSLGFLLRMAQLQLFEQFFESMQEHAIRPGELTVLWVIGLNPGLKQSSIARQLMIKPAHMTKLIQRLVRAGFIRRETPAEDRRAVLLSLTPKGHVFVDERRAAFRDLHRREREKLSDDEFAELARLLRKFTGLEALR